MPSPETPRERGGRLFTIPNHVAFADALARGLIGQAAGDPLALSRMTVLLPNRRAVTAVTDAFVRAMGEDGAPAGLLLPRLTPVGDLGDDGFERLAAGDAPLPPEVPALLRRFELARLVRALPRPGGSRAAAPVEALRLGDALAGTLDALLTEEVSPERLREAAADAGPELAGHWQATLVYLDLIITAWPAARGEAADSGTRLALLIDALVARWRVAPPAGPVVVAGVTGHSPPLVRLLSAVLALPQGQVVLPGLDTDLSEAGTARWEATAARAAGDGGDADWHPQFAVKTLLARLGWARDEVADWGVATPWDGPDRDAVLHAAMAPADALDGWTRQAVPGVALAVAATRAEEAQVIALALRQALEVPGQRAALVTPDRGLARRVAAHCRRWGIAIDDSAGTPLRLTPPGALLLALATALVEGLAPVALLAVLKHPLAGSGDRLAWLRGVRALDLALRGQRPVSGLAGIDAAVAAAIADPYLVSAADKAVLGDWWPGAAARLGPLEGLRGRTELTLPELAAALRETGDALAGEALWSGQAGRMAAARLAEIEAHGAVLGPIETGDAADLIAALLAGCDVREPVGHPRLAILGPVEAQLAQADLMILGGLDEGVWPAVPAPDPWLAPAIRSRLGLPGAARGIGLAAQDFVRGLGAKQVLLTRARRDAGGPLVASRFLRRLQAITDLPERTDLVALARGLDAPAAPLPVPRPPLPAPDPALRPRRLNVTDVDTLIADPFAFYARAMLRLRPLDPLDDDPDAAMKGELIHGVLEDWVRGGEFGLTELERLAAEGLAAEAGRFPLLRALWLPRARAAIRWAGETILEQRAEGWTVMVAEAKGEMVLENGIALRGRADRVDRDAAGRLAVVDYKTGGVPSGKRVQAGDATQLGLTLALAVGGHLAGVAAGAPGDMVYWQLSGGKTPGTVKTVLGKQTAEERVAGDLKRVLALSSDYLLGAKAFRPKLRPAWAWGDYDHLARVGEWENRR